MKPAIRVGIPEPKGSEFENFDRAMRILIKKKPQKKTAAPAPKQDQERERLPRP